MRSAQPKPWRCTRGFHFRSVYDLDDNCKNWSSKRSRLRWISCGRITPGGLSMAEDGTIRRIDAGSTQKGIDRRDALIIDARDDASSERGHAAAPNYANEANLFDLLSSPPREKPVLISCYHGNSSQLFTKAFIDCQFHEVFSLDGGYDGWVVAQRERAFAAPSKSNPASSEASPASAMPPKS
jgi:rhodanese-related sulfurtransferase